MALEQRIDQNLKEAMISKDAHKVSTLRFLKSALKYIAIEKKTSALSDLDVQQVIQKQIKQRRESLDQFSKAGRVDLADKESQELKILESYLPQQMSGAELEKFIKDEMTALSGNATLTKKDFGRLMKLLSEKLTGRADARRLSEILGKILQS